MYQTIQTNTKFYHVSVTPDFEMFQTIFVFRPKKYRAGKISLVKMKAILGQLEILNIACVKFYFYRNFCDVGTSDR